MINIYSINIKEVEKYYQKELFGATTVDDFSVSEEANKEEIKELAKSLLIKRYVTDKNEKGLFFSTSFSGHYYLIATYDKEIGIDIQRFIEIDTRLINYTFSKDERSEDIREVDFARVSALKKSLMKCAKVNQEIKLNDLTSTENIQHEDLSVGVTGDDSVDLVLGDHHVGHSGSSVDCNFNDHTALRK